MMLQNRRVTNKFKLIILMLALSLWSIDVSAKYHFFYNCPRYTGSISIGDGAAWSSFLSERPPVGQISSAFNIASSDYEYASCTTKDFFCLKSLGKNEGVGFFKVFPILLPRIIEPGKSYEYQGLTIESRHVNRLVYQNVVRIVVRRGVGPNDPWYSLTVASAVGVIDFHFSDFETVSSETGNSITIKDVTCYLDSKVNKGLFSNVTVRPYVAKPPY